MHTFSHVHQINTILFDEMCAYYAQLFRLPTNLVMHKETLRDKTNLLHYYVKQYICSEVDEKKVDGYYLKGCFASCTAIL